MIKNKTKNFMIIEKERYAKGIFAQGFGLMFRLKKHDFGLIFPIRKEKKLALTMWMVFFSIDVLYLDSDNKVVEIIKSFRPFTNYFPKNKAMCVIEFPIGFIKDTCVGDEIAFKE